MSTTIQLIDEATAVQNIGRLALGKLCMKVAGELTAEIAQWFEDHPGLPFTIILLRSGGQLHQLWVLLNAVEARHEDVRRNNQALMRLKMAWKALELGVIWEVPADTRTFLYTF